MADTASVNPNNPDSLEDDDDQRKRRFGEEPPAPGALLELSDAKAAKLNADLFLRGSKTPEMSRNLAQWTVNELRRRGVSGVSMTQKSQDRWEPYIPANASPDDIPGPNKLAATCRRTTAIMFADPPEPDAIPGSGEDDDVEATELAGRILEDLDSESGLNETATYRRMFDKANTFASAFAHYMINPRGGGYVPIEVEAHPDATSYDDALEYVVQVPVMVPNPLAAIDPAQEPELPHPEGLQQPQMEVDEETGEQVPVKAPWPTEELVTRYVCWDGTLTDDKGSPDVAHRWSPKIEREILTGKNVHLSPANCEDIWDASMVHIASFMTWGKVKEKWPKFRAYDEDEDDVDSLDNEEVEEEQGEELGNLRARRDALFGFKPEGVKDILEARDKRAFNAEPENVDDRMVAVFTSYAVMGDEYAQGCCIVTLGESEVAYRDTWCWEKEDGTVAKLDIPVTQLKQFGEGTDNPYGHAMTEILGRANEARLAIWDSFLRWIERLDHQLIFAPYHANYRPEHGVLPYGTLVKIMPGTEPKWQDIPAYPQTGLEFWSLFGTEMDHESGLEQAAQGVEDSSVQSGIHAQTIISQVQAGLSELRQNTIRAVTRGWRIKLQLVGAFYDVPQKLQWAGDDREYQVKAWLGSDLASVRDVKLKAGSFTQMAPQQKAVHAQQLLQMRVISQDRYNKIVRQNMASTVGVEEDEHIIRIRRQLSAFRAGPPDKYSVPGAEPQPIEAPPMLGPDGVTPIPQPPQWPPIPELQSILEPVPADELTDVAQERLREIADFMATKKYLRFPPWWRVGLEQEFRRMQAIVQQAAMAAQAMRSPAQVGAGAPESAPAA